MNGKAYRTLTPREIGTLQANGCSALEWGMLKVAPAFSPDGIRNCRFTGVVRLGNNVHMEGVGEIRNYEIGDNVVILHIESLVGSGQSAFGNGVQVAVLNESGGREVTLYNGLSAQTAYILAMYRHRPKMIQALERGIAEEIRRSTPAMGRIGNGTTLRHCGTLIDICTGESALLQGVAELTNGTVNSSVEAPAFVGRGVIARDFIIAPSTEVTDFAHLEKCYIGEGCRIGKGFTAENSLFFANCDCLQGEACAVFAGPYTVTHHKSTLLIGGFFSFYNAGSGTNQSNHMYRLGPIHQGVLERGTKTTSSSYILFPARIGAFSVVKGRHYHHPDISTLPFSYLIEERAGSLLLPGLHLKSIGLLRDTAKWPERDRRKGVKTDRITFGAVNPYTLGKIRQGIVQLNNVSPEGITEYNGVRITPRGAQQGSALYQLAIDRYIASRLLENLEDSPGFDPGTSPFPLYTQWADLCGLIVPTEEIERLLDALEDETLVSVNALQSEFERLERQYPAWEWAYTLQLWAERLQKTVDEITSEDCVAALEQGIASLCAFERLYLEEAQKEYAATMQISYGIDGNEEQKSAEFRQIHGTVKENAFLRKLQDQHREEIERMEQEIRRLKSS